MAKVFYEDIYNLGLLYVYIGSNGMQKMVLLDDLKKFYNTIEKNLEEMNSDIYDMYASFWYDNDAPIYFISSNKNNEVYYILKPGFNLERAERKYMGCLSSDVIKASLMENALSCLIPFEKKEDEMNENNNQKGKYLCLSPEIISEK